MSWRERTAMAATALRDVMVDKCAGVGRSRCWCRSAARCLFTRCTNCDMPIDENGKALFDDFNAHATTKEGHYGGRMFEFYGDEPVPCPYCNGPMPKL